MLKIHLSKIAVRAFLFPGFKHTEHFHVADSVLFSTRGLLPDKARFPAPGQRAKPLFAASAFVIIEYQILPPISW